MYVSPKAQRQLKELQESFINPYDDPDHAWMRKLNKSVKALTGADKSIFVHSNMEQVHFISDDIDESVIQAFQSTVSRVHSEGALDVNEEMLRKMHRLRCQMGPHVKSINDFNAEENKLNLNRSAIYNDVIVPAGLAYPVVMGKGGQVGETAQTMFGRQGDAVFKQQALFYLNRLLPYFISGINGYVLLSVRRQAVFEVFEALPEAILIYNPDGQIVFTNFTWTKYIRDEYVSDDLEVERLNEFVEAFKEQYCGRLLEKENKLFRQEASPPGALFLSNLAQYRIEAFYLPAKSLGRPHLAVRLTRKLIRISESVTQRYRLSPRECEVIQLLVKGHSNQEIADKLFLSVHTVRRHVEAILKKLRIHSRTAVLPKILEEN